MNDKKNSLTDKVNVTMHPVALSEKDISYAKVQRETAYIGNVIDSILKYNKTLDRETLLFTAGLFRNGILELLQTGKAVDLLEMGILYIKPDGGMETASPGINDVPSMKVAFTPSELALEAVKGVSVAADVTATTAPEITEVFDMHTRKKGTEITSGQTVRIKGKRLKVAGNNDETGVFLASCDENGKYSENISEWIQIKNDELIDNTGSVLLFNVPVEAKPGAYRLIVRTAYGSGTRINKTVRAGIHSEAITVSA